MSWGGVEISGSLGCLRDLPVLNDPVIYRYLAKLVFDDGKLHPMALIIKDMIHQRGFPGAEKSCQDCNRDLFSRRAREGVLVIVIIVSMGHFLNRPETERWLEYGEG